VRGAIDGGVGLRMGEREGRCAEVVICPQVVGECRELYR
jgi:hypothetical protein